MSSVRSTIDNKVFYLSYSGPWSFVGLLPITPISPPRDVALTACSVSRSGLRMFPQTEPAEGGGSVNRRPTVR